MWEQESDWNRYYDLEDGGLRITPEGRCIINSFKGWNYHQFVREGDKTKYLGTENRKYILLKKYDELMRFIDDFDLDY